MALLEVKNLSVGIATGKKVETVVRDISFSVEAGKTLGIVGESGSGKSMTSLAIMGLLAEPQVRVISGEVLLNGEDILKLSPKARRGIMGSRLSMIFQEPMTSLNPVYTVGYQITETLKEHTKLSRSAAMDRAIELLRLVGIPDPKSRVQNYPHQMSGGMRQRVMIAMALACEPDVLIADEPTTALDVTVQAQILELLRDLQKQNGMAIVLISHDLGVIAEMCDSTAVMYRGQFVETAPSDVLFEEPSHPYTRGLMASIPSAEEDMEELVTIPGRVPMLGEFVSGCVFHPRCHDCQKLCEEEEPTSVTVRLNHQAKCHYPKGQKVMEAQNAS